MTLTVCISLFEESLNLFNISTSIRLYLRIKALTIVCIYLFIITPRQIFLHIFLYGVTGFFMFVYMDIYPYISVA